jgi:uncharacterized membrane protein
VNDFVMSALKWYAALGSALMAGLFFVFSVVIMSALDRLSPPAGIVAMQSINRVIVNPLFMLAFMGTGIVALVLGVASGLDFNETSSRYALIGCLVYLIGVIVVTFVANVPRNDAIDKLDPNAATSVTTWKDYVSVWTAWNHVRTAASIGATILFILVLRD